jgi:hypothetical protein
MRDMALSLESIIFPRVFFDSVEIIPGFLTNPSISPNTPVSIFVIRNRIVTLRVYRLLFVF